MFSPRALKWKQESSLKEKKLGLLPARPLGGRAEGGPGPSRAGSASTQGAGARGGARAAEGPAGAAEARAGATCSAAARTPRPTAPSGAPRRVSAAGCSRARGPPGPGAGPAPPQSARAAGRGRGACGAAEALVPEPEPSRFPPTGRPDTRHRRAPRPHLGRRAGEGACRPAGPPPTAERLRRRAFRPPAPPAPTCSGRPSARCIQPGRRSRRGQRKAEAVRAAPAGGTNIRPAGTSANSGPTRGAHAG